MFLVGLTGGIATGKSTVSKFFQELFVPIIDADVIAREVVEPGKPAWKKIKAVFGNDVFMDNGELNREKLGQIIFSDARKRQQLNGITHPEIYKAMLWQVVKYFFKGHRFVILDLPLLFESKKMIRYFSSVIVVCCDEQTQIERLINRNKLSPEEALKRIQTQMALIEKCELANFIIDNNNNDLENLKVQVHDIHKQLQQSYSHWKIRLILLTILGGILYFGYYMFH